MRRRNIFIKLRDEREDENIFYAWRCGSVKVQEEKKKQPDFAESQNSVEVCDKN